MAPRQASPIVFTGLRGRDGSSTSMIEIPTHKARECLNVDFDRAALARKRGGATSAFAGTTNQNTASIIATLARHVPGADETLAELWQLTSAATPILQRLAGGTAWASITLKDAITTRPQDAQPISFNGKLFWLADTAQDRHQVFDPALSTTTLRRAGLATPSAAPTVADTGSGSYAATIRYYRVREVVRVGSNTVLLSEASSSQSFTPSGSGTAARVTKPADMGEGATHWRLEGATASAGPWRIITTTAVGSTTYDDSADPSSYAALEATEIAGDYAAPSSYKYGIADGARLLVAGAWESSIDPSSVYFTPVLGSTSAVYYDDERVPANNRIPLDPKDGGVITGFGGPFENQVIVSKYRQMWRLIPTGIEEDPYRRKAISKVIGSISQKAMLMAEDDGGTPTLYWLSHLGPYRFNLRQGLSKLVWDVKDIWDTVNLAATTTVAHAVYHSDRHQIWWWIAVGSENEPTTTKLIFDTRLGRIVEAGDVRDGWCKHTGDSASARCSVMFSRTLGATMSRDLKPYIGQNGGNGRLWTCDTTDLDDAGTAFQGLVTYADRHLGGLEKACTVGTPLVLGSVGSHSITVSLTPNYDTSQTRTGSVSMAATGSETRTLRPVEDSEMGGEDVFAVALAVGDASAVASAQWTLDACLVPAEAGQQLAVV